MKNKSKCSIPWFVMENRTSCEDGKKKASAVMRERRAIVMAAMVMVLIGSLLALAAAYSDMIMHVILWAGFIVGFLTVVRTVFVYCKGE